MVQALTPLCDVSAHDSAALMAAAGRRNWDIVRWLLPHSDLTAQSGALLYRLADMKNHYAAALESAIVNEKPDTIALLMPITDMTEVKNLLVKRLTEKPTGVVSWATIDDLGRKMDRVTQTQWVNDHPGCLPRTEAMQRAFNRQNSAGQVAQSATRSRLRP